MTNIKQWLTNAKDTLVSTSDTAQLDAEVLLSFVLKKNKSYLYTYPEETLSNEKQRFLDTLLKTRQQGKPIAYITGKKEFWSLPLIVNEDTLIPRPETEHLIEIALDFLQPLKAPSILDLGTGSGAIACALAKERPDATILATDKSVKALAIGKKNATIHHLNKIKFTHSDWFSSIKVQLFDLIVSNPPYIDEKCTSLLQDTMKYEPKLALISAEQGFFDLFYIIKKGQQYLKPSGMLLLEHGFEQASAILHQLQTNGYFKPRCYCDLARKERVSSGIYKK